MMKTIVIGIIASIAVAIFWILHTRCYPEDVPGTYRGMHFGGTEVIEIIPNGTFTQNFSDATRTYSVSGTWKIVGSKISFSPFLYLLDDAKFAPHQTGVFTTRWDLERRCLFFGEEPSYSVSKVLQGS